VCVFVFFLYVCSGWGVGWTSLLYFKSSSTTITPGKDFLKNNW